MIMMSRIEMELRIRQQGLLHEAAREQAVETAKVRASNVCRQRIVHSQFYMQRFGRLVERLKVQPA